jgi:hypothetical protein
MDRRTQQPNIQHLILHDFSCVASHMDDPARYYKVMITKCCTRRILDRYRKDRSVRHWHPSER